MAMPVVMEREQTSAIQRRRGWAKEGMRSGGAEDEGEGSPVLAENSMLELMGAVCPPGRSELARARLPGKGSEGAASSAAQAACPRAAGKNGAVPHSIPGGLAANRGCSGTCRGLAPPHLFPQGLGRNGRKKTLGESSPLAAVG